MLTFLQYLNENKEDFPDFLNAQHVVRHIENKHPGVDLNFYDTHRPDHAALSMIKVPKHMQRQGIGSYAMKAINHYADHHGKTITLSPESMGKGQPSKSKLVSFYRSHGYMPNKGRNKDYRFSDSMIRSPKKSLHEVANKYYTHWGIIHPSGRIISGDEHKTAKAHKDLLKLATKDKKNGDHTANHYATYANVSDPNSMDNVGLAIRTHNNIHSLGAARKALSKGSIPATNDKYTHTDLKDWSEVSGSKRKIANTITDLQKKVGGK